MKNNNIRIFIAAPLFNEMERERNEKINKFIKSLGYKTFLAQNDVGLSYDLIWNRRQKNNIRKKIFESDVKGLISSDIILFLLDGRTPDEGMCIEVGMGWILDKPCIAYKTDNRAMDEFGDNNIMIDGCIYFTKPIHNLSELKSAIIKAKKKIIKGKTNNKIVNII